MVWAKNGTPVTLGGTSDTVAITDMTANKFNFFISHIIGVTNMNESIEFNGNVNNVYSERSSKNGVYPDTTATSQPDITIAPTGGFVQSMVVGYVVSISGEEKLVMAWQQTGGTGAAAPNRSEVVGKFVPSPDADITRIDINNGGTGDYTTNTNLSALGSDGVLYVVQDGAIFYETDTNKAYVLYNGSWTEL
tara:strand:+ start:260 stop:835 length:576 start_codon:yes stop_codon:yes gene_type:complete